MCMYEGCYVYILIYTCISENIDSIYASVAIEYGAAPHVDSTRRFEDATVPLRDNERIHFGHLVTKHVAGASQTLSRSCSTPVF